MAEVGLVASVFGIASLGACVSKALFDLGYTMRHAHEQIDEIAGEVTTFTTIIRQLGIALKAQRGSFTNEAEKMIDSSMKDCKRLLKTIRRQVKRKKESMVAFRWLFRKKRAEELKRRMDALRGVLGLMLQVVQLGKKFESDTTVPDALSELREEMKMLKNEVLAYHRSLPKLQEAEMSLHISARPVSTRRASNIQHDGRHSPTFRHRNKPSAYMSMNPAPPPPVPVDSPFPQQEQYMGRSGGRPETQATPVLRFPDQGYHPAESDVSDYVSSSTQTEKEDRRTSGAIHSRSSCDEAEKGDAPKGTRATAAHGSHAPLSLTYLVSQRLIASMPYNPTAPLRPPAGPARLTASTTQVNDGKGFLAVSPEDEATSALKLLFAQWTKVSPRLIEDVLNSGTSSTHPAPRTSTDSFSDNPASETDFTRGRRPMYDIDVELSSSPSRSRSRHRPYTRPMGYDGYHSSGYPPRPPPEIPHPRIPRPEPAGWGERAYPRVAVVACPVYRDAWRRPQFEEPPLAKVLARYSGRFVWMLRNPTELTYWVDKEPRVRYRMTPPEDVLVMPEHSETMLPKQWVLKEVLELFGFVCRDDSEAYWAVDKELTYVEVRQLVEVSSHLIEKNIRKMAGDMLQKRDPNLSQELHQEEGASNKVGHFTAASPASAPRSPDAGPLVAMPRPVDMQLTRVERHAQQHLPSSEWVSQTAQDDLSKDDKDHHDPDREESRSMFSSKVGSTDGMTPSRLHHSDEGGHSSSNLSSYLTTEHDTGTAAEPGTRRRQDRERRPDPKRRARRGKDEARKTRSSELEGQSQATDTTRSRRRHRDRKHS